MFITLLKNNENVHILRKCLILSIDFSFHFYSVANEMIYCCELFDILLK